MKPLQRLLPSDQGVNALFVKLILGFFTIILLLVVFHFVTISISTAKMRSEVIRYNTLQLESTADKYEQHFELLKRVMTPLLIDEQVQSFARQPDYIHFPELQEKIMSVASNPMLFIRDILLYSEADQPLVLSKSTSTNPETMFRVFLANDDYSPEFWKRQLSEPYRFKVLPAVRFADHTYPTKVSVTPELFPIVFKPYASEPFLAVALVDAERMIAQFHVSVDGHFAMLDGDQMLFASDGMKELGGLPAFFEVQEAVADDHYVFRKVGQDTGFAYVSQVPVARIEGQAQLTTTLLFILAVSILVSLSFAVVFIRKIHNPLGEVLASLKELNAKRKTELLHYRYINMLKEIHPEAEAPAPDLEEMPDLPFADQPFVILLFDFVFRSGESPSKETEKKWLLYMREIVERSLSLAFERSVTLQIEKHQVLSFVFLHPGAKLEPVLEKIKGAIDTERAFGFATIAVSSVYDHSDHLTAAYEEALSRLGYRRFDDETEIVAASMPDRGYKGISLEEEQRLDLHLREGNADLAVKALKKMLTGMKQRNSLVLEVENFINSITDKCMRMLSTLPLQEEEWQDMYARKQQASLCRTYEQLEAVLEDLMAYVCKRIQKAKSDQTADPVIDFIVSYVEQRYGQEVYLDDLAEQLKMSSGYLSTYFKEKTGTNFIDYLHGVRIAKAQEMLESTELKIKEVAERAGYQNLNSFNRMFKKFTGVTPSDYRRNPAPEKRVVPF